MNNIELNIDGNIINVTVNKWPAEDIIKKVFRKDNYAVEINCLSGVSFYHLNYLAIGRSGKNTCHCVYETAEEARESIEAFNSIMKQIESELNEGDIADTFCASDANGSLIGTDRCTKLKYALQLLREACSSTPFANQVGGCHYKSMQIQPTIFCQLNNLNDCESQVIHYVTRHKEKNGVQDIEKAIHCLQLLKELEYGE